MEENTNELENPKVSIIVPVYNAEKYLTRCLDSLVKQDFPEFEILLINDAATDCSMEIMQSFEERFSNIRIIKHEKNMGLPSARKTGLYNAKGEYIYFVDADDWIEKETISSMYINALEGRKDIVYAEFDRVDPMGNIEWIWRLNHEVFEIETMTEDVRIQQFIDNFICFWGKMYKRKWFIDTDIQFMEGASIDEDNIEVLFSLYVNSTGCVNKILYHYFDRPESMSNTKGIHIEERYACAKYILSEAKRLGIYEKYKELLDFAFYRAFFLGTIAAIIDSKNIGHPELEKLIKYAKVINWQYLYNEYVLTHLSDETIILLKSLSSKEAFADGYCHQFGAEYIKHVDKINELLQWLRENSRCTVFWSAGKMARTFLIMFPDFASQIAYVVDQNPNLDGMMLESGVHVRSIAHMDMTVDCVIVPRKKWIKEIRSKLRKNIKIVDLMKFIKMGE